LTKNATFCAEAAAAAAADAATTAAAAAAAGRAKNIAPSRA
jgi:hypothetical protein